MSLGRLYGVTLWLPSDAKVAEASQAFEALQSIYDKHNVAVTAGRTLYAVYETLFRFESINSINVSS